MIYSKIFKFVANVSSILFASLMLSQFASATEACDPLLLQSEITAHGERIKKLLTDKLYSALEDELEGKKRGVETGEYNDHLLLTDMRAAFKSDPVIEPLLTEWIKTYPKSYSARIARAIYYINTGYSKRGTAFADKTSTEQYNAMKQEFDKAASDLEAASHLSTKPTLVYAEYIHISRAVDGPNIATDILRRFPDSLAINVTSASSLNPKWGGSFEQLDALIVSAETAKMEKARLKFLHYQVEMEKANYFDVVTRQKERAIEHYIKAGNICQLVSPWENAQRAAREIDDWKSCITVVNDRLTFFPPTGSVLQNRGFCYEKIGKISEAIKDYDAAAELGSAWAQSRLGWLLWKGNVVSKDLARAKLLLEKSAAQGDQFARTTLPQVIKELEEN